VPAEVSRKSTAVPAGTAIAPLGSVAAGEVVVDVDIGSVVALFVVVVGAAVVVVDGLVVVVEVAVVEVVVDEVVVVDVLDEVVVDVLLVVVEVVVGVAAFEELTKVNADGEVITGSYPVVPAAPTFSRMATDTKGSLPKEVEDKLATLVSP
jgi:hypothetical protein